METGTHDDYDIQRDNALDEVVDEDEKELID